MERKEASAPEDESLWTTLRVFEALRPYRRQVAVAVALLLAATLVGLSFPYLTGLLLDAALEHGGRAGWAGDINAVALVLLGTLAVQAVLSFFATYGFSRSGEHALVDLRRSVFGRLVRLPMDFFGRRRVGELTSRLSSDMAILQDTLTGSMPQFFRQATLMIGGIALVAATSLRLTALMLCTFPLLVLAAIFIGKRIRRHAREGQDKLAAAAVVLDESLQGIATVKAFGAEGFETARYGGMLGDFLRVIVRASRLRASLVSFIIFGVFGSVVGVFWYGAHLLERGDLTFGELTRFILYTTFVGGSVASFADLFGQFQRTAGATQRLRELMREAPEEAGRGGVAALDGGVVFESVHFAYPSRPDHPVLDGLDLAVRRGEKVALVGPSGAGKSTAIALLLRFYEPDRGRILLDGRPARDLSLTAVRAGMAVVPQDVLLFGGTIGENIRYGRPDATEAQLREASCRALCDEFIGRFPEGYDTVVGDRGVKLSGGQRQRIAIARALLADPAILILDEATSSLDAESERLIQQALAALLEGRTAIIIAHRLATVRSADQIFLIEAGRVTERGTHEQLLQVPGGRYAHLAGLQFATGTPPALCDEKFTK